MKKVDRLLSDYAAYHRTRGNIACHFIGIPLIIYGILALLQQVHLPTIAGSFAWTGAEILITLSTVYYLSLDIRLALTMLVATALLDAAAYAVSDYRIGLGAFVMGWIFQGIGHAVYEKRSPAFLKNLLHLMVGPIFVLNEALRFRPVSPAKI